MHELDTVEDRLKRAKNERGFRQIHSTLIEMRVSADVQVPLLVTARYNFLRALAYAKAVRSDQAGFLRRSSTECLQFAFGLFTEAETTLQRAEYELGMTSVYRDLRQHNAYEAGVLATVLNLWGELPENQWYLQVLQGTQKSKVDKAIKRQHSHMSRF